MCIFRTYAMSKCFWNFTELIIYDLAAQRVSNWKYSVCFFDIPQIMYAMRTNNHSMIWCFSSQRSYKTMSLCSPIIIDSSSIFAVKLSCWAPGCIDLHEIFTVTHIAIVLRVCVYWVHGWVTNTRIILQKTILWHAFNQLLIRAIPSDSGIINIYLLYAFQRVLINCIITTTKIFYPRHDFFVTRSYN